MEAARAGDHGHGFAVVAEEVRRLAAMSSDAAERTERVVERRAARHRAVAHVERAHGRDGARRARSDRGRLAVVRSDRAAPSPRPTRGRRRSSTRSTATNGLAREMSTKLDSLADGHRIVRRGDGGSRRVERRAERQHGGDRRRGGRRSRAPRSVSDELVANLRLEKAEADAAAAEAAPSPSRASLAPGPHAAEHAKSRQADAALEAKI